MDIDTDKEEEEYRLTLGYDGGASVRPDGKKIMYGAQTDPKQKRMKICKNTQLKIYISDQHGKIIIQPQRIIISSWIANIAVSHQNHTRRTTFSVI